MLNAGATIRSMQLQARRARANPVNAQCAALLAAAIIFTGALDAASTELALMTGRAVEANPLIAALQRATGDYWILPKMVIHGWLAAGIVWFPNRLTLFVMSGVAVLVLMVAINNFLIFRHALSIA